ncbi:MAG TPA: c-type cytochrome [Arcobacter sp.]|nr:c-type cytochrome [Arcobacter sp.]HIP56030.1 c-type cytochrome [Arcobacter sp.]
MKKFTQILLGLAVLGTTTLMALDGQSLYNKCSGCHGVNGEKKALGKSEIIKGWEKEKTLLALQGYKDGTYGGIMKGVMKGQVSRLTSEDIESLSTYISTSL